MGSNLPLSYQSLTTSNLRIISIGLIAIYEGSILSESGEEQSICVSGALWYSGNANLWCGTMESDGNCPITKDHIRRYTF